jgi:hypothetical protein
LRYATAAILIFQEIRHQPLPNAGPKNGLTREKFSSFLEWLSPDMDRAGEEYERLRFRLCTFFSRRKCSFADDLADETINRVILKASQEKIESKIAYCFGDEPSQS